MLLESFASALTKCETSTSQGQERISLPGGKLARLKFVCFHAPMFRSWSGPLLIAVVVKEAGRKDLLLLSLERCFKTELYCCPPPTALHYSCRQINLCPVSYLLIPILTLTSTCDSSTDPHLLL